MCKKDWCVRLGQNEGALGRGNYLKYLKKGSNRKKGSGNKDFKKVGNLGQRDGCLKKGRLESPYEIEPGHC